MNVLLVSNQYPNEKGIGNPILFRMRNALEQESCIGKATFVPVHNSLRSLMEIRKVSKNYDIVHIHFGGLYALIIWFFLIGVKCQKFITFHGTDIHAKAIKTSKSFKERLKIHLNQKASFLSILLFDRCGFVAESMLVYVPRILNGQMKGKAFLQPLGVDYSTFKIIEKEESKRSLGLGYGKYVLFSDISNTSIKRRDIAESIIKELGAPYDILIMSQVKPEEVPWYINACDFAILTSDEEGSPNIIREVLSLNKPFFSVDVGDAKKQLEGLENSSVISRDPKEAAKQILKTLEKEYTDNTRQTLRNVLDFTCLNKNVIRIYEESLV